MSVQCNWPLDKMLDVFVDLETQRLKESIITNLNESDAET